MKIIETHDPTEQLDKFKRLVTQMRQAQRNYFRTHGGLDECKKIERAVDKAIDDLNNKNSLQRKLF